MSSDNYLRHLPFNSLFKKEQTDEAMPMNPVMNPVREEAECVKIYVFDYKNGELRESELVNMRETERYRNNGNITWINIEGLRKSDVDQVCAYFGIHPLIAEDILSMNQRPKMDDVEGILFCLLNML